MNSPPRIAIVGAGWAGLAAAVRSVQLGHRVTLFEAARTPGGRARRLDLALPDGGSITVDNGQHILIGAYTDSLALMRTVGVDPDSALLRLPLTLRYPDGSGLALPRLPAPWDAAVGMLRARGWRWADRLALLRAALAWQRSGFACDPSWSVARLCQHLPARVVQDFIDPLCVAALNTPLPQASAAVFLRVLHDALMGPPGGADLLLPRHDLGALLPGPAVDWLRAHGANVRLGHRVQSLNSMSANAWQVDGEPFDHVLLALPATAAAQMVAAAGDSANGTATPDNHSLTHALQSWSATASALQHHPIATVYTLAQADSHTAPWPAPMLALRADSAGLAPAQFVFDRSALQAAGAQGSDVNAGALPPNTRLLAFVASVAPTDGAALEAAVLQQAHDQLGSGLRLQPLRTVTDKRATFACTPGLLRPPAHIAPGLLACGDYVDGPYPATLEGAVRSGQQAAEAVR